MKCTKNRVSKILLSGLTVMATLASISLIAPKATIAKPKASDSHPVVHAPLPELEWPLNVRTDGHYTIQSHLIVEPTYLVLDAYGDSLISELSFPQPRSLTSYPIQLSTLETPFNDESR